MGFKENLIVLLVRVFLFFVYLAVGAAIFQALEHSHQQASYKLKQNIREAIQTKYNITDSDLKSWAETYKPNMQFQEDEELEWNFGNSFLFAAVTVTTIGYGNIAPQTFGGRLFCIFYAFIGIPGACLTLKVIGDSLYAIVAYLLTNIEQRLLKRRCPQNIKLKTVIVNLTLTVIVILPLLSLIVYVRERKIWTYFECFYFTFTTLTTIGYGDYVPYFGNSLDFLLVAVALFGLAFVSSILCSLNNLYEDYGLSRRVVHSIKKSEDDIKSDESSCNNNLLDEEETKLKANSSGKSRRHSDNNANKRPSVLHEKRESISVGIFQA